MAENNRTEYFRKRRQSMKQYAFLIDNDRASKFEEKLKERNIGKTEWFRQKVDEEINSDGAK